MARLTDREIEERLVEVRKRHRLDTLIVPTGFLYDALRELQALRQVVEAVGEMFCDGRPHGVALTAALTTPSRRGRRSNEKRIQDD